MKATDPADKQRMTATLTATPITIQGRGAIKH